MTRKPLSFFILDTNGNPVRRLAASTLTLWCATIVCIAIATGAGFTVWDYYRLTSTASDPTVLEQHLLLQQESVAVQQQQLAQFETTVDALQNRIEALHNYERRIRHLARIEKSPSNPIYGLGGSMPDDAESVGLSPNLLGETPFPIRIDQEAATPDATDHRVANAAESTPPVTTVFGNDWYADGPTRQPIASAAAALRVDGTGAVFSAPPNSVIQATAGGVVAQVTGSNVSGHCVVIDHGHGFCTRYTGEMAPSVSIGERIALGSEIARLTKSAPGGSVTFKYQVTLNGLTVNPSPFLLNSY